MVTKRRAKRKAKEKPAKKSLKINPANSHKSRPCNSKEPELKGQSVNIDKFFEPFIRGYLHLLAHLNLIF